MITVCSVVAYVCHIIIVVAKNRCRPTFGYVGPLLPSLSTLYSDVNQSALLELNR